MQAYKRAFKEWGWGRYLPGADAKALDAIVKRRRQEGKDTVFLYRGRLVTSTQVAKSSARAKQVAMANIGPAGEVMTPTPVRTDDDADEMLSLRSGDP